MAVDNKCRASSKSWSFLFLYRIADPEISFAPGFYLRLPRRHCSADVMRQFVAELNLGVWTAWEVTDPMTRFNGPTATKALQRLCTSLGLNCYCIERVSMPRPDRFEFVVDDDDDPAGQSLRTLETFALDCAHANRSNLLSERASSRA